MIEVGEPRLVGEIPYRSSGTDLPRDLRLPVSVVEYRSDWIASPVFLATSDLQGRETGGDNRLLGEAVADEVVAMQADGRLPAIDHCFLCGDFYDYPDLRKMGGTGDVTEAINALSELASSTYFVFGNHDEVEVMDLFEDIEVLDGTVVRTAFEGIGDVSGIVGNPRKNQRRTDVEFANALDRCLGSETKVVLMHQGPKAAGRKGLPLVNELMRRSRGSLVLFGHAHWEEPFEREGGNLFCNVDARVLVFVPAGASAGDLGP